MQYSRLSAEINSKYDEVVHFKNNNVLLKDKVLKMNKSIKKSNDKLDQNKDEYYESIYNYN